MRKSRDVHPDQKLKIKLEIDVDPPLGFRTDSVLVHNPIPFHVLITISAIFLPGRCMPFSIAHGKIE